MTNIFIHLYLINQNPVRDSILVKYKCESRKILLGIKYR